jgi:hypothetical protein
VFDDSPHHCELLASRPLFDRYQVYGERCSGTHFLIKLLERNITSARFTEAFGFKHWFVDRRVTIPESCLMLVVARHPYDWARSFHRKPWHAAPEVRERSFARFIRDPWIAGEWDDGEFAEQARERDPVSGARFADIWALRRAKLAHWLGLCAQGATVVPIAYETVAAAPERFLNGFGDRFRLDRIEKFVPVETYKGLETKKYEPRRYRPLADADRAYIDAAIAPSMEAAFGYEFAAPRAVAV